LEAIEYVNRNANPFNPILLVGAKNADNSSGLYLLKEEGMVYPKVKKTVEWFFGDWL
jgi:hypothetical protein